VDSTRPAVVAEGLRKNYGDREALAGLDLTVASGSVCALLGSNGAGKTTAVRILTTLLRPDGGRAEVAGFDVVRQGAEVRARIGLVGQQAAVDEVLSGRQNLELFGRLSHLGAASARRRADELLDQFGPRRCGEQAGQGVLGRDAPPARPGGRADPRARSCSSSTSRRPARPARPERGLGGRPRPGEVRHDGGADDADLEEADQLAATVLRGPPAAAPPPTARRTNLKNALGGDRIDVVVRDAGHLSAATRLLERVTSAAATVDVEPAPARRAVVDRMAALTETVRALAEAGIETDDIALRRPTLDEVFLHLTAVGPAADAAAGRTESEVAA
jgi:ABC-2 type transport system ATP-binding protein